MNFSRFNEAERELYRRDVAEREDEEKLPRIAAHPLQSLPQVITDFNERFGTCFDPNGQWSAFTLSNMAFHARHHAERPGDLVIAHNLTRHAEVATVKI